MDNRAVRLAGISALLGLQLFVGCGSDTARSAGDPCTLEECEANLCYDETCEGISAPEDDDRLSRSDEAALQTVPFDPDSDGDEWIDGLEVVWVTSPHDEDGDGKHDALESTRNDRDGDCLVDQKDPDDNEPLTDPALLADLGCCCYGPCSEWGIEVATASCEVAEDGTTTLVCPKDLQPDSDGDGVADPCDLCPQDAEDLCDPVPHGLTSDPPSPGASLTPTISGHAFWAQTVSLYSLGCDGESLLADEVPVDALGRFAASVAVTEDTTTTLVARAHRIGDKTSGPSAPFDYTHPDVPILELEHGDGWQTHLLSSSSELTFRVTAPSPAVDWSLFPFPNCAYTNTAWGAGMSGLTDKMSLGSGHVDLGPSGTETAFSARVEYADGTQSGCSDAAVYVRQAASPAVAAWLVDPVDPSHAGTAKSLPGSGELVTVRLAVTEEVTDVSIFADHDCASSQVTDRTLSASLTDVMVNLPLDLGVSLGDAAVTEVPIGVMVSAEAGASACVALTYVHDPVAPAPPELAVGESDITGTAEVGAQVTVFEGPGCDACLPTEVVTVEADDEATGPFEVPRGEAETFSAHVTDAAGNVSACAEQASP